MDAAAANLDARLLRILSNPARLRILALLRASGAMTVGEIHQRLGIAQANASQHLAVLRRFGLVRPRRNGRTIWYSIVTPAVGTLIDAAGEVIAERQATGGHAERDASPTL